MNHNRNQTEIYNIIGTPDSTNTQMKKIRLILSKLGVRLYHLEEDTSRIKPNAHSQFELSRTVHRHATQEIIHTITRSHKEKWIQPIDKLDLAYSVTLKEKKMHIYDKRQSDFLLSNMQTKYGLKMYVRSHKKWMRFWCRLANGNSLVAANRANIAHTHNHSEQNDQCHMFLIIVVCLILVFLFFVSSSVEFKKIEML